MTRSITTDRVVSLVHLIIASNCGPVCASGCQCTIHPLIPSSSYPVQGGTRLSTSACQWHQRSQARPQMCVNPRLVLIKTIERTVIPLVLYKYKELMNAYKREKQPLVYARKDAGYTDTLGLHASPSVRPPMHSRFYACTRLHQCPRHATVPDGLNNHRNFVSKCGIHRFFCF